MTQCVILNADYSYLNLVDWRRALKLIVNQKAEVLSYSEHRVCSGAGQLFRIPAVLRLIKLIRTIYRSRVPFSKRNVLVRDGFACAYCGGRTGKLTIDHIIPRSRGGETSFENCVASCKACNGRKGCRSPREAHMALRVKPHQPTISEFLRLQLTRYGIDDLLKELGIF